MAQAAKPTTDNKGAASVVSLTAGHRARLRERFLTSGAGALADYELLELLLFGAVPQKDTKPIAKELLKEFGTLENVLHAPLPALQQKFPNASAIVTTLKLAESLAERLLKNKVIGRQVFSSWERLLDYCQLTMARLPHEELRLLFLDSKNALITEEIHQRGTTDQTAAYPREIVKRALEKAATAIILVHNHPAGDPTPSRQDIDLTREIKKAADVLGIALHDHLIIGQGDYFSFKAQGLL